MKNLEIQSKAFNSKWLVINMLIVIAIICLNKGYGYIFVIDAPQYVHAVNDSIIISKGITLNGRPITSSDWTIRFDQPKRFLSGARYINFSTQIDESKGLFITLDTLGLKKEEVPNLTPHLKIMVAFSRERTYSSSWPDISPTCGETDIDNVIFEPINGALVIDDYSENIRYLKFRGHIDHLFVKPRLIPFLECINNKFVDTEHDAITLGIDRIDFDISSPLIYEWSNKAGDTWRL